MTSSFEDVPRLVLAGAESTGKTTLARAIAEREAHQCKTQTYSDIQHRETKARRGVWFCPRGFGSIKYISN